MSKEGIMKRAKEYRDQCEQVTIFSFYNHIETSFRDGAEWMLEQSITWFYKNAHKLKYWDDSGCLLIHVLMNDYRREMEGEND